MERVLIRQPTLLRRHLLLPLLALFTLLTVSAGPNNALHEALHGTIGSSSAETREHGETSSSTNHNCELCLNLSALDTGSIIVPQIFVPQEFAFLGHVSDSSIAYSHPLLFSLARGPPTSV